MGEVMIQNLLVTGARFVAFLVTLFAFACVAQQKADSNGQFVDDTASFMGVEVSAKTTLTSGGSSGKTYYLPFGSGETYTASTYSGHGEAWDFNLRGTSGNADCGEPVMAITDGIVTGMVNSCDSCSTGWGNYVQIDHDSDSYYSRYAHLDEVYVEMGQWVQRGQTIGTIGTNGSSTSCHIHLQIERSGSSTVTYSARFYYYNGSSKVSGSLSSSGNYQSCNNNMFDEARSDNGGSSTVGSADDTIASRVAEDGFSKSYSGGSYGDCTIYYQALGCNCGDTCPTSGTDGDGNDCIDNTQSAFLVRTGFYDYYVNDCGGPASSSCGLGFPTDDEYSVSGGARQSFEHGYLTFSSADGSVTKTLY